MKRLREVLILIAISTFSIYWGVATVTNWRRTPKVPSAVELAKRHVKDEAELKREVNVVEVVKAVSGPLPSPKLLGKTSYSANVPYLILALKSDCGACKASAPVFREVLKDEAITSGRVVSTAILLDDDSTARDYLNSNLNLTSWEWVTGVIGRSSPIVRRYSAVEAKTFVSLGIRKTPTVLLIKNGQLVTGWIGGIVSADQILQAIKAL